MPALRRPTVLALHGIVHTAVSPSIVKSRMGTRDLGHPAGSPLEFSQVQFRRYTQEPTLRSPPPGQLARLQGARWLATDGGGVRKENALLGPKTVWQGELPRIDQ